MMRHTVTIGATPDFPRVSNLVELLNAAASLYGDRPMLGVLREGKLAWTSYREGQSLVDRFRGGLASLGVDRGATVAVISRNRIEWAVGAYAVYGLGAKVVPLHEAQSEDDWRFVLEDSGASVCLVGSADITRRLRALQPELPALRHIVQFDGPVKEPDTYAALIARGRRQPRPQYVPAGDETAMLIYTSGTTGKPKGVVLTHSNLVTCIYGLLEGADVRSGDLSICYLPWTHVFAGCIELNLGIMAGGSGVICGDPQDLPEYIPLVRPTVLFGVPRVWNRIYATVVQRMAHTPAGIRWIFDTALRAKQKMRAGQPRTASERLASQVADWVVFPRIRAALGGRLRCAVSGAAALPAEVLGFLLSAGIDVQEGYGLTECGGAATAQPKDALRPGSVGRAIPGLRIQIDTSVMDVADGVGEIVIYGDSVMRGYHNRPEETALALTADGGLRTGDLGYLDRDGYLYITGRIKELYKLENGRYVAPVPIEARLEMSPFISQAIVTGDDRPYNVALIVADMAAVQGWAQANNVVAEGDALLSHAQVLQLLEHEVEQCNTGLKGYERIVEFAVDSEAFSTENGMLTHTLKPKRHAIMDKYGPAFEALYPPAQRERRAPRASYVRGLLVHAESA